VRARFADPEICVVVNDAGVVAGVMRSEQFEGDGNRRAEEAMRPGPSTFRPHVEIGEIFHYMSEHELTAVPITSADGKLVGVLHLDDARRAAHGDA
jgi:CBS domain-containing protein